MRLLNPISAQSSRRRSPVPWLAMNASTLAGSGAADAPDPRYRVPGPVADGSRPAAAPRVRDHLAAGPGPDGVRLPALDRPDPRLAAHLRGDRVRDHVPPAAGDHVARERAPDRATASRSSCACPGTEHGDWWSMKGWWIFAGTAAVSILSKHVIRFGAAPLLQPVELRPRALLRAARRRRGPTRSRSGGGRCRRGSRSRS